MTWRKFVLYCHISPKDETRLRDIAPEIRALLKEQHGLLVLFVDTGLKDLLQMIHPIKRELPRAEANAQKQRLKADLRERSRLLGEGDELARRLEEALGPNARVLASLDLVDVFSEMGDVENLKKYLIGTSGEIRYDTPKFVESVLRLRMIGSRVPVLRLDSDVLIPPDGERFNSPALTAAILGICEAVQQHHDATQVLATILSANYDPPADGNSDVMAWNRGFATRILPSLLVPDENTAAKYLTTPKRVKNWGDELQKHFCLPLTQRFLDDLWKWGAPKTAVISGALLYMNDAVALNVPPFSNFSQRVMWIDDHLRYVLHREMGDFCRQTQHALQTGRPLNVLQDHVKIAKYRVAENFLHDAFAVRSYLPSLIWGSFFDYWLCPRANLKRREENVNEEDLPTWRVERRDGCPGILATAVRAARAGCLPDEGKLLEDLKAAANVRLEVLRTNWGDLQYQGEHSLASAWVHDQFPASLKTELTNPGNRELPKIATKLPDRVEDFRDGLKDGFNELLDDTCRYVKWVFEWPHVVSVIRSVPPGEFKSDLEWDR